MLYITCFLRLYPKLVSLPQSMFYHRDHNTGVVRKRSTQCGQAMIPYYTIVLSGGIQHYYNRLTALCVLSLRKVADSDENGGPAPQRKN